MENCRRGCRDAIHRVRAVKCCIAAESEVCLRYNPGSKLAGLGVGLHRGAVASQRLDCQVYVKHAEGTSLRQGGSPAVVHPALSGTCRRMFFEEVIPTKLSCVIIFGASRIRMIISALRCGCTTVQPYARAVLDADLGVAFGRLGRSAGRLETLADEVPRCEGEADCHGYDHCQRAERTHHCREPEPDGELDNREVEQIDVVADTVVFAQARPQLPIIENQSTRLPATRG